MVLCYFRTLFTIQQEVASYARRSENIYSRQFLDTLKQITKILPVTSPTRQTISRPKRSLTL